jgi:hypothetical protein
MTGWVYNPIACYVLGGFPFSRASLASQRSFISFTSSCNFSGSCSTAACSHSTFQRSLFGPCTAYPRI